jgi:hypothetical protein
VTAVVRRLSPVVPYNRGVIDNELTGLQRTILEIESLGLPLRESVRLANARVGFFVGQQRYKDELARALEIIGANEPEAAEATG